MATNTTKLGLRKPGENDFYNQQTEQADNWDKVDKFADDIQNLVDNNSGKKITGYIQDDGEKVLGNYYLDKLTTGLFKCTKSGNINYNSSEYFEDYSNYANGNKLQNLSRKEVINTYHGEFLFVQHNRVYTVIPPLYTKSILFPVDGFKIVDVPVWFPRFSGLAKIVERIGDANSFSTQTNLVFSNGSIYGGSNLATDLVIMLFPVTIVD